MRAHPALLAAALLGAAAGCHTPPAELNAAEAICAQQGIPQGTPAFTRCVQQQSDILSRSPPPVAPGLAAPAIWGAPNPGSVTSEPAPASVPISSIPF